MLSLRGLRAAYGRAEVLHGIDLTVEPGEVVAVLGPNGAGKSSLLRAISRAPAPAVTSGELTFLGESLRSVPPYEVARRGLIHVPEGRHVFAGLSVTENLVAGTSARRDREHRYASIEAIGDLFPRLRERRDQEAGSLSGGEQQMLAIGRALVGAPKLLVLDEPSLGLAPKIVDEIFEVIRRLAGEDLSILLVEQSTTRALAVATRSYVMDSGTIALEGTAAEMAAQGAIQDIYLGGLDHPRPSTTGAL
jgi:branched-chain amino acid transport system ATP-binding protein